MNVDNTNTNIGGSGPMNPMSPSPPSSPPSPAPSPAPPVVNPVGRVPDPPTGTSLPLPSYGASVAAAVPFSVWQVCTNYGYLDAVVDALRVRDTRWGYVCSAAGCASPSLDKIAYHAVAGPEVPGALGIWVVDVIRDVCGSPVSQWLVAGFAANTGWASRARF